MSDQTKEANPNTSSAKGRVEQEFQGLSLEDKFAILFKMEVAALGEALSLAVNDPMKVLGQVGSKLSDLGDRIEAEFRRATATKDGADSSTSGADTNSAKKGNKRQSAPPSTAGQA